MINSIIDIVVENRIEMSSFGTLFLPSYDND